MVEKVKSPKTETEANTRIKAKHTSVKESASTAEHKDSSGKSIAIAVLATALACIIITFGILLSVGVIKFDGSDSGTTPSDTQSYQTTNHKNDNVPSKNHDANDQLIDNPNPKVAVNGTKVTVDDLEFYLPSQFEFGGKNNEGAYTYNLTNDDGWAQVLVYAEKSNLTPEKFLTKISPNLDVTDKNYVFNSTHWVQAENANSLAYATKLDGKIYAIYYSVKLDSEATGLAMQMIPKTLYMSKIYAD